MTWQRLAHSLFDNGCCPPLSLTDTTLIPNLFAVTS